jgi:hypothetical protein
MTNLSNLYGAPNVSDEAYDESTWDGVTTIAPSKNAVRDEFELKAPKAAPTFTGLVTAPTINLTGGQIEFPATAVPDANVNTLDDYEEGTWTPTVTFATPGNLSVSYSENLGNYTKIGRIWIINFIIITSSFTHTTASGAFYIAGLPFSPLNYYTGAFDFQGITKVNYTNFVLKPPGSAANIGVLTGASGLNRRAIDATAVPTGGSLIMLGSITAA